MWCPTNIILLQSNACDFKKRASGAPATPPPCFHGKSLDPTPLGSTSPSRLGGRQGLSYGGGGNHNLQRTRITRYKHFTIPYQSVFAFLTLIITDFVANSVSPDDSTGRSTRGAKVRRHFRERIRGCNKSNFTAA